MNNEPIVIEVEKAVNEPFTSEITSRINMTPQPLRCWLKMHRYSGWSGPVVELIRNGDFIQSERRYQVQLCLDCNSRRERRVSQL